MKQPIWNISACVLVTVMSLLIFGAGHSAAVATRESPTPTMKDWLSIQEALYNYHRGLDTQDNKTLASAFTEDGAIVTEAAGGLERRLAGRDKIAALGAMGGAPPPSGPPPPPGERWHITSNDHYVFESPTRVRHYCYWLDLLATSTGDRSTKVNVPGHYEDVLEKQGDGRWLMKERKVVVGRK